MRIIKQVHKAVYAPIGDLVTYRAIPTHSVEYLDPFLFLNHHGPQEYGPNNSGLPFGPHPHRGFETLTFILQGEITHKDSAGGESTIYEGGIQWMTAGSGLIHSEESSDEFKRNGGMEEVIQLWLNLPSTIKMTEPDYTGLQRNEIPHISEDGDRITLDLISGEWKEATGPVNSLTGVNMMNIHFEEGGRMQFVVPVERNILVYVVHGRMKVNDVQMATHELAEFEHNDEDVVMEALQESRIIFGHGEPFNEPIVASGPFVMNSQEEIQQAYEDFQSGRMGVWSP